MTEARGMTPDKLQRFICTLVERSKGATTIVGVMTLAAIAGMSAALAYRGERKFATAPMVGLAALAIYREVMRLPGPFRVIAFEKMLHPTERKHFETKIDPDSWGWVRNMAAAILAGRSSLSPEQKTWLEGIRLNQVPYGWSEERPPNRDGFHKGQ
jgi:hypothetical protein